MLLLTMSVLCTCVILKDIDQPNYCCIVVLKLVSDIINMSYTPCHICVCQDFVKFMYFTYTRNIVTVSLIILVYIIYK